MKLDEFINKYINTKVDFDNAFVAQSVDLFRQYCKDVLNIPHTGSCATTGGAKDLYCDWEKMPLEKNISKVDDKTILVFEQNGIKQNGARLVLRAMENILGVLRVENECRRSK